MGMTHLDLLVRDRDGTWFHGEPEAGWNGGLPQVNKLGELVLRNASKTNDDLEEAIRHPERGGVPHYRNLVDRTSEESVLPVMRRKDISWEKLQGPAIVRGPRALRIIHS